MTAVRPCCPGGLLWELPSMDVRVWGDAHSLGIRARFPTLENRPACRLPVQLVREKSAQVGCNLSRASGCLCKFLISHCPNLAEGEAVELIS